MMATLLGDDAYKAARDQTTRSLRLMKEAFIAMAKDKDQLFILWTPNGGRCKPTYAVRLYTPETFFKTMKYEGRGHFAFIVKPNVAEEPARLTQRRIRGMFPQFLDTAYAKAAMKDERRNS